MSHFFSKYQNTVLVVAYHLPPLGGIPVMRVLRLVRYLPQFGWQPVVLTSDLGFDFVHGYDHSLIQKIPHSTALVRVRDPLGPFLKWTQARMGRHIHQVDRICKLIAFPDEKIFWGFRAYKAALNYFEKSQPDFIHATGYPWTSLLVGMWLKRVFNKPLVVDLRDPWTLSPMPVWSNFPHHRKLEHKIIKAADGVIFTSEGTTEEYRRRYPDLAEKMIAISNGFDPEDFKLHKSVHRRNHQKSDQIFRMIYAGSLGDAVPPGERTRTLVPLLKALKTFKEKYPVASQRLVLQVYSNDIPNTRELAKELGLAGIVTFSPRLSHREIVEKMLAADAGVLIVQGSADGRQIVPAKLYEYIAAGLPVLAMAPESSETAKIIGRYSLGHVFSNREQPSAVADAIYQVFTKKAKLAGLAEAQAAFNGVNLVGQFTAQFEHLIKEPRHEIAAS